MTDVASKSCISSQSHRNVHHGFSEVRLKGVYCWGGNRTGDEGGRGTEEEVVLIIVGETVLKRVIRRSATRLRSGCGECPSVTWTKTG